MVDDQTFCAQRSLAQQEPLGGSAPGPYRHWLVVEDNGPWGRKEPNALALLDPPARERWDSLGKQAGLRRVFVRRPGLAPTMPQMPRRFWLGTLEPGGCRVRALGPRSLVSFLDALETQGFEALEAQGELCEDMWLVCTHGRRDRCCSLYGMGVFTALAAASSDQVWQCSHLGGHRFAATALHLPSGYLWGQLQAQDAQALAHKGTLALPDKLRGHSGLGTRAQLVDLALRQRTGQWSPACADRLWDLDEDASRFNFEGLGVLDVQRGPQLEVLGSCGDTQLKSRPSFELAWRNPVAGS